MTQNNTIAKVEVRKGYYESGALLWEIPCVNGIRHGIVRGYYESGALWYETPYVRGNIHGIVKNYDEGKSNIDGLALYEKGHEVASLNLV